MRHTHPCEKCVCPPCAKLHCPTFAVDYIHMRCINCLSLQLLPVEVCEFFKPKDTGTVAVVLKPKRRASVDEQLSEIMKKLEQLEEETRKNRKRKRRRN